MPHLATVRLALLPVLLLAASLAGCVANGPAKRLYPPQVSLQEVSVLPSGKLAMKVRIQNYSTVAMDFSRIEAWLRLADSDAGKVSFDPATSVGPGSAEVVLHEMEPLDAAMPLIEAALRERKALRYQLKGNIAVRESRTDYDFEFESALNPVPGVDGVLR